MSKHFSLLKKRKNTFIDPTVGEFARPALQQAASQSGAGRLVHRLGSSEMKIPHFFLQVALELLFYAFPFRLNSEGAILLSGLNVNAPSQILFS